MALRGVVAGVNIGGKADDIRGVGPARLDEGKAVGVDQGEEEQVKHQHHHGHGRYG
ncbi:hypothetical protein GHYDROH2_14430 [Geobacter hydrogenophilus]|uniref:Uncharacterized protein n=1 Tax=Geobacter hydrogenophilus TaxID=40983 RepID=A0A9W6G017_9BACT|nr:hypothetical protein GHYDROH2_14430 [Geobacter hydrogenophilus]